MRRAILLLLLLGGCPAEDQPCTAGWSVARARGELDRPLLSLWGAGDEVYAVGGGVRDATLGAIALRFDGDEWTTLDPQKSDTLWWVWGPGDGKVVWMVGEHGLVLRWNGRAFETLPAPTTATLYGVWGSGPDDVWLVGGTPGGGLGQPNDLVYHWDGRELTPDAPPARGAAFFKVWGAGQDDVWVAGEAGTLWRRTPAGWQGYDAGTRDALTTIHGCGPSEVYAVGGMGVYRFDGVSWAKDEAAMPLSGANGVFCGRDQVLVVGNGGLKLRYDRAEARWIDQTFDQPYYADFHAAWISPSGALWAAGGNYNAPSSSGRYGMLGRNGCP